MAQSSDELIKREIVDYFSKSNSYPKLRIFPQSSREDQALFSDGGLTFGVDGTRYGSCDAVWYSEMPWIDRFHNSRESIRPLVALEGTDALSRGSSGNAQYQRFHHALGAVRNKVIGVYYFRKGLDKIQPDLYGMATAASKLESTPYVITDDLLEVSNIVRSANNNQKDGFIETVLQTMQEKFNKSFQERYNSDWQTFANARSTIIKEKNVIKYAGRNIRNFTESSQRAGHIAVGEMYLTKYFFPDKKFYYLFPRMTSKDLLFLDQNKSTDKEWFLLRNEPNVEIKTVNDLIGIEKALYKSFIDLRLSPLKGSSLQEYTKSVKLMHQQLENGDIYIK
jgi:hypothetical protein